MKRFSNSLTFSAICTFIGAIHGDISFEGTKAGGYVSLTCSVGEKPIASTVEFLVDGSTAFSIRLYNGQCYRTTSGIPCKSEECHCSSDGRRYFWTYQYKFDRFRATCRAKLREDCMASSTILFTVDDSHVSKVGPKNDCPTQSSSRITANTNVIILGLLIYINYYMIRCSPSHFSIWLCVIPLVILQTQIVKCENGVSMSWELDDDSLSVYCDIKNLHYGVEFKDPRGLSYHCTAAIANLVPGDCTQNLPGSPPFKMQQDIHTNRTKVKLTRERNECENGIWQCVHGTNTGQSSNVTVSVSRPWNKNRTAYHSDMGTRTKSRYLQILVHFGVVCISYTSIRAVLFVFYIFRRKCLQVPPLYDCNERRTKSTCNYICPKVLFFASAVYAIIIVIDVDLYEGENMIYITLTVFVGLVVSIIDCVQRHFASNKMVYNNMILDPNYSSESPNIISSDSPNIHSSYEMDNVDTHNNLAAP